MESSTAIPHPSGIRTDLPSRTPGETFNQLQQVFLNIAE